MKIVLFVLLITTSVFSQQQKYLTLNKNNQGGFNIYDSHGNLLFEYTKLNCDSLSLEKLNSIFNESLTSKNDKQQVAIINLQDEGIDYSNIIIALATIFSGLGGLWIGNHLSSKSQIKHSKLQLRIEEKRKWINDLRMDVSNFIAVWSEYDTAKTSLINSTKRIGSSANEIDALSLSMRKAFATLLSLRIRVDGLLNSKESTQNELKDLISDLMLTTIRENDGDKQTVNATELGNSQGKIMNKIMVLTNKLIMEETEKLSNIDKDNI